MSIAETGNVREALPVGTDRPAPRVGLVLGAGGVQGAAWLTGALQALATETGWDPMAAERIVGTSAGSAVGAMIASGTPLWFMIAHSAGETLPGLTDTQGRRASDADRSGGAVFRPVKRWPPVGPGSWPLAVEVLRRPNRYRPAQHAAAWLPRGFVSTDPLKDIVRRASGEGWSPHHGLWVVACDYATGRRTVFGRPGSPRAELADAVAASCAIPGYYHPVEIGGRRYVDGGMHSVSNLDVLRDAQLDLVICLNPMSSRHSPRARHPAQRAAGALRGAIGRRLGAEAATLRAGGTEVVLIQPLAEDLAAIGHNLMRRRGRNHTIRVAIETVTRQLAEPHNQALLANLPKVARREKIHRPQGPPSEWPALSFADFAPGAPAYQDQSQG